MIIQVEGATAESVSVARQSLEELVSGWGGSVSEVPPEEAASGTRDDERVRGVDPVALAALVSSTVLAVPSAVLAVGDLADRMRKRRRAAELIEAAKELGERQVSVRLVERTRTVEIRGLDADQLLELLAKEDRGD
jgi:hypothetical protein